jgi:hypothetical protein
MTDDFAGVALEASHIVIKLLAPVLGVMFAVQALRRHSSRTAQVAVTFNELLVLMLVYQFVDAIRPSFFAPLD